MEIESLIREPAYSEVKELCSSVAEQGEYVSVPPTPVVSPFWETTFTPSSSEIIFRKIESSDQSSERFCACQPCIRITDLPHLKDGWHRLLFHMVSFISFDTSSVEEELSLLIRMLTDASACDMSELYFTVSTDPVFSSDGEDVDLGGELLQKLGVPHENLFFCSGTANYQDASLSTAQGVEVSMTGPKVEVFVQGANERLLELGTFEVAKASLGGKKSKDVFAFVIGLERTTAVRSQNRRVTQLPVHKEVVNSIRETAFKKGFASTSIAKGAANATVAIADAMAYILSETNYKGGDPEFDIKGLRNHYNRAKKSLKRVADSYGIPYSLIIGNITEERKKKKHLKGALLDKRKNDGIRYA